MGLFDFFKTSTNNKRMIAFNTNVSPDKYATETHPNGKYNFTCITSSENKTIISLLNEANKFPLEQCGIALAFFGKATTHKSRYIINQIIIEHAKRFDSPLNTAAKFIALSQKGSFFRKEAIEAFERIPKQLSFPKIPYGDNSYMYSWGELYLIASELYQKEYQYDKAIEAIEKSRVNGWYCDVCTRIHAEILMKIDINQAVKYLQNSIAADSQLSNLKPTLNEYKEKAAKGYKFKPRKAAHEDNTEIEQQLQQLAYRYLKTE